MGELKVAHKNTKGGLYNKYCGIVTTTGTDGFERLLINHNLCVWFAQNINSLVSYLRFIGVKCEFR